LSFSHLSLTWAWFHTSSYENVLANFVAISYPWACLK
jgi:hypothetical protein